MSTHENLSRTNGNLKQSSDRFFGLTFFVVFLIIALWPLKGQNSINLSALCIAMVFLAISFFSPTWLAPLNRQWLKFGELLHCIVSPFILGIMFFGIVTPVSVLLRLAGKDLLNTKFDNKASSYWIKREPPGPIKTSLKKQF